MSDLDPLKRLEELGESAVERLVDGSEALEAIRRTASFLQAAPDAAEPGAGIPAYGFIPYPVVFVILARWFHHFPDPDAPTRRALATWLWRGVATAVHQRAAVSALRLQMREIKADDMADSLQRLLSAVGGPKSSEWSNLDPFHANHAASRVELLACSHEASNLPKNERGTQKRAGVRRFQVNMTRTRNKRCLHCASSHVRPD